jgi:hypothetical protein
MMRIDQMEDLRMSIGLTSEDKKLRQDDSSMLIRELDKARRECAELKKANEQMTRDKLNQTFGK